MVYVASDLHGFSVEKLKMLLKKVDFSEKDKCFILGDVIDRGDEGIKTLRWILQQSNMQMIMGNHEAMFLSCDFLFNDVSEVSINSLSKVKMDNLTAWINNGAKPTIDELTRLNNKTVKYIIDRLKELPLYETVSVSGKNFILTHSGLGNFDNSKEINNYTAKELLWNRPNLSDTYYRDSITIFGHTPTCFLDKQCAGKAIFTDTWIDIDTGVGCGFPPMLLRLNDMKEFYIED